MKLVETTLDVDLPAGAHEDMARDIAEACRRILGSAVPAFSADSVVVALQRQPPKVVVRWVLRE